KGILIEDPNPMKKKDQVEMDAEYAKKLQKELDKEHEEAYKQIDWNAALDHVKSKEPQYIKRYNRIKKKPQSESEARKNMISYLKNTEEMEKEDEEIIKSINETPAQKVAKRRKLSEEAQEADDLKKRLEIVQDEDDGVFVEATPLAQKVPVVDYQIVVIDNKPKYKIIRADDTHQFYISFTTLLKNFVREDLETLWRIVRDRFSTSKPTNISDEYLLLTLKTMFGELDGRDAIWRNQKSVYGLALVKRWKLLTSCGVHVIILSTVQLFLLVERRYPLSRFTLEQLVNVARLQVEEESESYYCQSNIDAAKLKLKLFKMLLLLLMRILVSAVLYKRKGVVIRDPEEELHTDTLAETPTVKDKGKEILIEAPKPMKKKDQVEMDAEYVKKLQEELDKEHEEAYK
nr:hypothetical protein [Tanacetum cinerariifolium]